jgi:phospholipase/lecithinase/hemolysin
MALPDLATVPSAVQAPLNVSALFHDYSKAFRSEAFALAHNASDYTLTVFDLYDLYADIYSRPLAYGFNPNVTHVTCLTGAYGEAPRSLCDTPDEYVFWDAHHVSMIARILDLY